MTTFCPLSKSPIWGWQRRYFEESGIDAWRKGDVPHYITNSPRMSQAYAELLLAFFRDRQNRPIQAPLYIIELGAGPGRFAYHLLKTLTGLCEQVGFSTPKFVYVLTDFVEETVCFWESHPRLQPFFDAGLLDTALFDAERDTALHLRKTHRLIEPGSSHQPLIVIGNYFFDSLPQELYHIGEADIQTVLLAHRSEHQVETKNAKEALQGVEIRFDYQNVPVPPIADALQAQVLQEYQTSLKNSHLLFPHVGIDCISRLHALSLQGLLLITADGGMHRLEELHQLAAPGITKHGSISLPVNYHALKQHCRLMGGASFFPRHLPVNLTMGCLLYLSQPKTYKETKLAYERLFNEFGPDHDYIIKRHAARQASDLSADEMFAYLRMSAYDARLFMHFLPRFYELKQDITEGERYAFLQTAIRTWDAYYPIGEEIDLALEIGAYLIVLAFYKEALTFFQISEKQSGVTTESLYSKALCHIALGQHGVARPMLEELKARAPDHPHAGTLLQTISS